MKNWETRGISKDGMITAQEVIGCSSTWLKNGTGEMARGVTPPPPSSKTASAQPVPTPEEIANALEWAMRPAGLDLSALGGRAVVVAKIQLALEMQNGGTAKPELTIMDLTKPDPVIPGISAPEEHKKAS